MKVSRASNGVYWAESFQTSYVAPGTVLHAYRAGQDGAENRIGHDCKVGEFPTSEQWVHLKVGDELVLTRELLPGRPASYDKRGTLLSPARIGLTLPEIFNDVREGERVLLDDGRIGGHIRSVTRDEIRLEITRARPRGEKLRADKGINLPDSDLRLPALTDKDQEDLAFVARHADLVGYSFVRRAADVRALQSRLNDLGGDRLGIILKIETEKAFEQLPNLILAAMHSPAAGVMIARGDLAVECGYERLAEVQEEILWICEAAHMPVIWATQVLESLAKEGLPSRAEITDAAMGERAECVMLNKGPYVLQAVEALDDILRRMESHQSKKRSMLRRLKLAEKFTFYD
jgi:pyruvate kinase